MKKKRYGKPKKEPKVNAGHGVLLMGGLFFGWLTYFTVQPALSDVYPQIWGLVIGGVFAFFGVACFWTMFRLNHYNEIRIPDLNKKQNLFQRLHPIVFYAVVCVGFGLFMLYIAYGNYQKKDTEITRAELKVVTGVVAQKVKIHKGPKGSPDIPIQLKHIPGFTFTLSGASYELASTDELITHVQIGDTLTIDMLLDEYQKKISREKPLGFWDKTVNYRFLSVYGLRDHEHTYLSFYDLNEYKKEAYPYTIIGFMALSAFFFGVATYLIKLEGIWQKPD